MTYRMIYSDQMNKSQELEQWKQAAAVEVKWRRRLEAENECLREQLEEISTKHERLVFSTMGDLSLRDREIERLRARVKLLEKTLIKAAIELEDQGLYEAPLMCRKIVKGEKE